MNSGDLVLNGVRYARKTKFYSMTISRPDVAGQTVTGQIQIDAGIPFLLDVIHAADTGDGLDLNTQEDWFIEVGDNESGYRWCDGKTPRSAFCGGRHHGRTLRGDNLIRANTTITITITDNAAPAAGNATLVLQGWNLFPV